MIDPPDITQLIEATVSGQRDAANQLFGLVYNELRRIAGRQMNNEPVDHTLQSTALVHEVWMKLVAKSDGPGWKNREHFFASAAQAMRRILVDSARTRRRIKRGGDKVHVPLSDAGTIFQNDVRSQEDDQLIALDEALELLREKDEVKANLVELRYFAGLTNAQASEQLGISTATAERYWTFAKAWLRTRMEEEFLP